MNRHDNRAALEFNRQIADYLGAICSPFLSFIQANLFVYARFYKDGKIIRLSNNLKWTEEYFKASYYNQINFYNAQIQQAYNVGSMNFLKVGPPKNKFNLALHNYGIWNSLTIARRSEDSVECFCFGAPLDNYEILSTYISNISSIDRFILYFMDRASHILNDKKQPFIIPNLKIDEKEPKLYSSSVPSNSLRNALINLQIKKYRFKNNIYLSHRETECLCLLLKGMSSKQIALYLAISPRTVESYICSLKIKLECNSKAEIVEKSMGTIFEREISLFETKKL